MRRVCVIEQDQSLSQLEASASFTVTPGSSVIAGTAHAGPAKSIVVTLELDAGEYKEVSLPAPMQRLGGLLVTASAFDGVAVKIGGADTLLRSAIVLAGPLSDLLGISLPGSIMVRNDAPEPRSVEVVFLLADDA
jgi:hypothetical protein